ncbi:Protein kinase domain [Trypanosoma vivax]|uniref:Protein kinase domain-containing protein n=1 Tax=Trypanosoma vivax (strain Y486) TaxID=1055687 RepID=G0U1E1_TRYVY|nr:putative protein kinase [Trypanosoma vivax]KAH8609014.1 Protein kinase domain [Trypanosoma vivax]CCC49896.1 putative protein kinase [Trypanosoma vivax Y486]
MPSTSEPLYVGALRPQVRCGARALVDQLCEQEGYTWSANASMPLMYGSAISRAAEVRQCGSVCRRATTTMGSLFKDNIDSATARVDGVGLPLPSVEPYDASTGQRLVRFRRRQAPVAIAAEKRVVFLHIVFRSFNGVLLDHEDPGNTGAPFSEYVNAYGTLLGYSDDDMTLIWHRRGDLFASQVPVYAILTATCVEAMRCLHCAYLVPHFETVMHLEMHQSGFGNIVGTFVGHERWGTACGDTGLMQQLQRVRVVGKGAQGKVELCAIAGAPEDELYVLKSMKFDCKEKALQYYHRAVRFMLVQQDTKVRGDAHLVKYLAARIPPCGTTTQIVMPYYSEGDLTKAIARFGEEQLDEMYICSIALQIMTAIAFLHERNPPIIHGDIKAENVLLFDRGQQVVLTDFDSCAELDPRQEAVHTDEGTTAWMAPEVRHRRRLMPASDVWAAGLIIYVLAVLPDFPMITNPATGEDELLNATLWDIIPTNEAEGEPNTSGHRLPATSPTSRDSSMVDNLPDLETALKRPSLWDCVFKSIKAKGYSSALAKLTAQLLSYDATSRPPAGAVVEQLRNIMEDHLLCEEL